MPLESGTYIIRNVAAGNAVGRNNVEGLTLLPKRVLLLPSRVEDPKWKIEKADSNGYNLKAGGGPAASIQDSVFAVLLLGMAQPENWHIEAVPQHGENRYIITTQDQSKGWVAPDEPYGQIKYQQLTATGSPPQYPLNNIFEIVSAPAY